MFELSAIRHPEKDVIIVRRKWVVEALRKLIPDWGFQRINRAAEILSLLEYHHNNRSANRILREEMKQYWSGGSKKRSIVFTGDWLPYTGPYIKELLGLSNDRLTEELAVLVKAGWISMEVPDDVKVAFDTRHFSWIKLEVNAINKFIDQHVRRPSSEPRIAREDITPIPTEELKKDNLNELVDAICEFHRHVLGKSSRFVYDDKRRRKVRKIITDRRAVKKGFKGKERLFSDDDVTAQCAQAIIGNAISPWHSGENDRNTPFNDIELIFRDNIKFELHLGYAEKGGVTPAIAYRQFTGFIAGEVSQFAKKPPKQAEIESLHQSKAYSALAEDLKAKYRDLARALAPFFINNTPISEILEFTKTNVSIKAAAVGIDNSDALVVAIKIQANVFRKGAVNEEMEKSMEKFSSVFCRTQKLNS